MTPEQEKLFENAIGDESDWPNLTNDPEVNYEIDRRIEQQFAEEDNEPSFMVPWAEADEETKEEYRREAASLETVLKTVVIDL
jgi:hypothetical protein